MFRYDADHSTDSLGTRTLMPTGKASARLHQLIDLMVDMIVTPLSIAQIAARSGLSISSMERLFRAEAGMSPGSYFQMLRLSRARDLAFSADLDLRDIALRCGYANASALGKAFKSAFGHPIQKTGRRTKALSRDQQAQHLLKQFDR